MPAPLIHFRPGRPRTRSAHRARRLPALAALALAAAGCGPPAAPAPARNLVVVVIDTLRADRVGAYGHDRDTTPAVDDLAARGVLFEDAAAHSNWTVPATASLLTSRYPSEHGAGVPGEVKHLGKTPPNQIAAGVESLGEVLRDAGFATGLFSANPYLYGSFQRGFQVAEVEWIDAGALTDRALAWLRAGDGRFFLYLQYMDLHQPVRPPQPWFDWYKIAGEGHAERHTDWWYLDLDDPSDPKFQLYRAHKMALYDGALRYVDHQIGRLLEALEESGAADDTLIVVTSDHGEEFWDHWQAGRALRDDPRGIWGVGHGHTMYEELLHVPLVLAGPDLAEGRRSGCPVRHLDVAPTVLARLGVPAPREMRGDDLTPLLGRGEAAPCERRPQIAESPAYGPESSAITLGRRKVVERAPAFRLLFDLRDDPGERQDLSGDREDVASALAAALDSELAGLPQGRGETMEIDAETEAALRALGYL
jgi:arylsulfatase A-like enzyme